MKLYELSKRLPRKAGAAKVEYTTTEGPLRIKDTIYLPAEHTAELYPLQEGSQFLFRRVVPKQSYGYGTTEELWFGGTDEKPFLTQLNPNIFRNFQKDGESAFYQHLKPKVVQRAEEENLYPYYRQGDFFALELSLEWKELLEAARLYENRDIDVMEGEGGVFNTRHILKGSYATLRVLGSSHFVVCGTLSAPDHRPLPLPMPSILVQADYLFDPKNAD